MHSPAFRACFRTLLLLLALGLGPRLAQARRFEAAIGDADRAIVADLAHGRIISAEPFGANQNTGSMWKVQVEHQGRVRDALFKPRTFGDRDGWARTPMEVAMYKLNRILGMDLVPPAAYRRDLTLNGQHFAEGALIYRVEDSHLAGPVAREAWLPRLEAFSSDLRVLSSLGRDADHENGNNIIRGKHWADGKYRVMKVDNEACLRQGAYVRMEHHSATWGPVTRFSPTTYARLKELNFQDLKADLGQFVSDAELNGMLGNRDLVVRHVREQVQQRGRDRVFMSAAEVAYDARERVGRRASQKQLTKFEALLRKKGAQLEYVRPGDRSLRGALGTTVLSPAGVTVKVARGRFRKPRLQTLLEELVHVNQLDTMAHQVGGHTALHDRLEHGGQQSRAIRASMESYAKGRVASTLTRPWQRRRVLRAKQRYSRQVSTTGVSSAPDQYWRHAFTAPASTPPASTSVRGAVTR